jgi:hypothetical protein
MHLQLAARAGDVRRVGPVIPPGDGACGRVAWALLVPVAVALGLWIFG